MRTVLASKVRKQNTELNLEFGLYKDGKIIFKYLTLIYELYCLTTVYQKKKRKFSMSKQSQKASYTKSKMLQALHMRSLVVKILKWSRVLTSEPI